MGDCPGNPNLSTTGIFYNEYNVLHEKYILFFQMLVFIFILKRPTNVIECFNEKLLTIDVSIYNQLYKVKCFIYF